MTALSGTAPGPGGGAAASRLERLAALCTSVQAEERPAALLFFSHAFALLVCYYILKTVREPLLLGAGSAEVKSYAYAVTALVLLVMVPLYGVLFRRGDKRRLIRSITVFFIATFALLYVLGRSGADVGFAYYVWVGIFGVMMLAQFWAHAAHTYNVESGQRLFPVIMAGGVLGGLAGPPLVRALFPALGPWNLLLLAIALLAATVPLAEWGWRAVPSRSRNGEERAEPAAHHLLGGFALVLRHRYLLLLAALVVLLNCVNATGEFILTDFVIRHAEERLSESTHLDAAERRDVMEHHIARFYGDYHFAVNALTALLQIALVARLFRWIGVRGALLVLPVVAFACYGLIMFLPVFGIVRAVKVLENATEYSVMNTVRHTLYLPLPAAQKFEGKTAIDTFFWRLGDVLQAGVIYAGLNWLGFEISHFALLNMLLVAVWIAIAVQLGKRYAGPRAQRTVTINWRAWALGASTMVFAVAALALPVEAAAERGRPEVEHTVLHTGAAWQPAWAPRHDPLPSSPTSRRNRPRRRGGRFRASRPCARTRLGRSRRAGP